MCLNLLRVVTQPCNLRTQEAEAETCKFRFSLGYIERPCLKKHWKIIFISQCMLSLHPASFLWYVFRTLTKDVDKLKSVQRAVIWILSDEVHVGTHKDAVTLWSDNMKTWPIGPTQSNSEFTTRSEPWSIHLGDSSRIVGSPSLVPALFPGGLCCWNLLSPRVTNLTLRAAAWGTCRQCLRCEWILPPFSKALRTLHSLTPGMKFVVKQKASGLLQHGKLAQLLCSSPRKRSYRSPGYLKLTEKQRHRIRKGHVWPW